MAGDEDDDEGEDHAFRQSHLDIPRAGEFQHVIQVISALDIEQADPDEIAGHNAEAHAFRDEDGRGGHHGQHARHHEVIHRVDAEGAQGIDLLGDLHGADLCRHGGADPPRQHEAR